VGTSLRQEERRRLLAQAVSIVRWAIEPLRSVEAHLALSKLGAVGVAYERDLFGASMDGGRTGLATDRLVMEWRLDAPRVAAVIDGGLPPVHLRVGLDKMDVITRTGLVEGGGRRFQGFRTQSEGPLLLAEVPEDVDRLRDRQPDVARQWRVGTRELFEGLLERGYLATGFVHEAGRSFYVFEHAERSAVFERPA
jgi:predicted GNAT superfamily acetyltransferase